MKFQFIASLFPKIDFRCRANEGEHEDLRSLKLHYLFR